MRNGPERGSLRLVVLGLSLSSSWGNGHATTYRALLKAFAGRGHDILFLERDVPWYRAHRDLAHPPYCRLILYRSLAELERRTRAIAEADAVIVGSYRPERRRLLRYRHARDPRQAGARRPRVPVPGLDP
jgi:spore maturation protein CgeB